MSFQGGTAAALRASKAALAAGDADALGDAIAKLFACAPERWISLLLIDGGVHDPHHRMFDKQIQQLAQALPKVLASSPVSIGAEPTLRLLDLLLVGRDLARLFQSARAALERAGFLREPRDAQTLRLCAFIQCMSTHGQREMLALGMDGDYVDISRAGADVLQSESGTRVSHVGAFESLVEGVELNIRFLQREGNTSVVDLTTIRGPFMDGDFEIIMRLATYWKQYEDAWQRVKYLGWRRIEIEPGVDAITPAEEEPFLRAETGHHRDGQHQLEVGAGIQSMLPLLLPESRATNERLARSITVPNQGQTWNGFVDLDAFLTATRDSHHRLLVTMGLEMNGYECALADLEIEGAATLVTWDEWSRVVVALRVLSDAFESAQRVQLPAEVDVESLRHAVIVSRESLVNLVAASTELETERASEVIAALTFDASRKHVELLVAPLLPLTAGRLVLTPALVGLGSPVRAVENFLERADRSAAKRSRALERAVAAEFQAFSDAVVVHGLEFKASDGKTIEYDVVVFWQGKLLLVECKASRGIYGPADYWRAEKEVLSALEQLERRARIAATDWLELWRRAPRLPRECPAAEHIVQIAVAGGTRFTGQRGDSVFVVDHRCLARFFGDAEVNAIVVSPDGGSESIGVVDRVRLQELPTAAELIAYLRDPAPVRAARGALTTSLRALPIVEEDDPRFVVTTTEYAPKRFSPAPR